MQSETDSKDLSICKNCGAKFRGAGDDCGVCEFTDTERTIWHGGSSTEFPQ